MRVGIDITYAGKGEGTGTYIRNLLTELASSPEVEWVTFSRPRPRILQRLPRQVRRVVRGVLDILWLQFAVPVQARQLRLDLFHAPAFIAPLFLPCPLVLTLLDAYQYTLQEQRDQLWSLYVRLFASIAVRRAVRVIAISTHAARDLHHYFGIPESKLRVTRLGVASQFRQLAPADTDALLQPYALDHQPFLLFVGAGDARKNYHVLIRALRQLRAQGFQSPPLIVTGNPTQEFRRLATEAIGELDIRFLEFVPEPVLVALYNRAALFVYPSRYEGFGLPVLEAMACGCPVICANTSSLPEVAGDAALLVDPDDPIGLASAIAAVLSDSSRAATLSEKGLRRATEFRWSKTAMATLAIYQEVWFTSATLA